MKPFSPQPWAGPDKLVIGIDIGTTHSAVSYAHLFDGGQQVVTRVGKWPGLPEQRVISKIPSIIYYNDREEPVLCGAEANTIDAKAEADEKGWQLAKHFKLHLHPEKLREEHKIAMDDLPTNITTERIYADFLRYLLTHTESFFTTRTANGTSIWNKLYPTADIVIAHPNGWGLREQSVMRRAAILAEVCEEKDAGTRVRFVSEGEASVHFVLKAAGGNVTSKLDVGTKFLVCDAGGSTVDITSYIVKKREPSLVLEEAKASGCVQAGGIYVNQECLWQLRTLFGAIRLPRPVLEEWLRNADEDFEQNVKPDFPRTTGSAASARYSVAVERASYSNRALAVKNGRLQLNGEAVASFFEPCVRQISGAIRQQLVDFDASHILLVGGFGESKHLQNELRAAFQTDTCDLTAVEEGTSKAVSDGAVIWNCTRAVNARIARYSYGTTVHPLWDAKNPDHKERETYERADGSKRVKNAWRVLVLQGALLKEATTQALFYDFPTRDAAREKLRCVKQVIYSHPGYPPSYSFVKGNDGNINSPFERVCEITADLSELADSLEPIERVGLGPPTLGLLDEVRSWLDTAPTLGSPSKPEEKQEDQMDIDEATPNPGESSSSNTAEKEKEDTDADKDKSEEGKDDTGKEGQSKEESDLSKPEELTRIYYKANFKIKMTFGDTELKAYIEWVDKGVTKTGPASVIASFGEPDD
ncbi:hypothetical protein DL93DRAFT_2076909 [Clavulina sp. PMI_390]|nr:hypothetical protein DL93DRAFT_2076909 [Clavulina sp. PMI_390]